MLALLPSSGIYSVLYDERLFSYTEGLRKFFEEPKENERVAPTESLRWVVVEESERPKYVWCPKEEFDFCRNVIHWKE